LPTSHDQARLLERGDRRVYAARPRFAAHPILPGHTPKRRNDAFTELARAIVGQQISVKAADATGDALWRWFRLHVAFISPSAPATVATAELVALRRCGLSQSGRISH
jgi:3-methyladenine DNA glycosylase/8-oxoguanine DNA glycosylase